MLNDGVEALSHVVTDTIHLPTDVFPDGAGFTEQDAFDTGGGASP